MLAFAVRPAEALKQVKQTESGAFEVTLKVKGISGLKKGKNIIFLKVLDSGGKPVEGAEITVTPWMPMMDHGTPWISKIHDEGGGSYRTNIPLTMGGHWEFRITIKAGDREDKAVFVFPDVKE
jgi:hypothetical protein